jgi:putative DNA primase/helicase
MPNSNPITEPIPEIFEEPKVIEVATDLDSSLRFGARVKDTLRYCEGLGWLCWDGSRWVPNSEAQAIESSKRCAREWSNEARRSKKKGKVKQALSLENIARIRAAVQLAQTSEALRIPVDALDSDPWLFNLENGTLDLRTGLLRPHRREDFITKIAKVAYKEHAKHAALDTYLGHLHHKDPEMVPFLARCFGAALTGDASAESLFLLQGDGGSGKTTLVEAMAVMLGDYAVKMRFESLCQSKHGRSPGGASPDLVELRGARLAYASEGDQSARLDAGLVKEITGNEKVTARPLYEKPISFLPTWKLWLVSNYDPKADSNDSGYWRRVHKLRFEVVPEAKRDPGIKSSLTNDPAARSALLSWCLAGCLDWQRRGGGREGLAAPAAVKAETSAYREKQDLLGQWWKSLLETAVLDPVGTVSSASLRCCYESWAIDNGAPTFVLNNFNDFLARQGLTRTRSGSVRGWKGIRLLPENENAIRLPGFSNNQIGPAPKANAPGAAIAAEGAEGGERTPLAPGATG